MVFEYLGNNTNILDLFSDSIIYPDLTIKPINLGRTQKITNATNSLAM